MGIVTGHYRLRENFSRLRLRYDDSVAKTRKLRFTFSTIVIVEYENPRLTHPGRYLVPSDILRSDTLKHFRYTLATFSLLFQSLFNKMCIYEWLMNKILI